ncbi:FtsX-like permease family protein [Aliihoeflea sp. 2WW]|uniref:ABC transporter permease n=1 Tax=Aliihoeflea sp. 2WW TaxID=1381123 RepID=UPI0004667C68|nr:FtsX-like permease family protein [Aliihoeflea sp. 2WW]
MTVTASGTQASGGRPLPVTVFVALKDLLGERLLSVCLILCVVAVLTPIMLLTSVKVGFIDRLKQDFISDPSFREIRPLEADLRTDAFFKDVTSWPGVLYLQPSVMLTPRDVDFQVADGNGMRGRARLVPTSADDPIFQDNFEGAPPTDDGLALSTDLAAQLRVEIGSKINLLISRIEGDRNKIVSMEMTVVGLVPQERATLPSIYATTQIDREVEDYRAGIAVPGRGWPGISATPRRHYSALVVRLTEPLGETATAELRIRVGTTQVENAAPSQIIGRLMPEGLPDWLQPVDPELEFLVLLNGDRGYSAREVEEGNAVLGNRSAHVIGLAPTLAATVLGEQVPFAGYHPELHLAGGSAAAVMERVRGLGEDYVLNNRVALPERLRAAWQTAGEPAAVEIEFAYGESAATKTVTVPVRVAGFVEGGAAIASSSLIAMIARGKEVPIVFDPLAESFAETSVGYRGFRLVGEELEDIPVLVRRFEEIGVGVRARSDAIIKLQRLERSLNILVAVVALVGLAGGYAILTASFFANVKRKQVDYATMRLIGMAKSTLFRIPIAQALFISAAGYAMSIALYHLISWLLNRFIAAELGFDGRLSVLRIEHFFFIGIFVIGGACLASIAASREATRIDPAHALRGA